MPCVCSQCHSCICSSAVSALNPPPPSPPPRSICDVAYSERAAAAAAAAPVALGRDVDSGSDDAGKSSQRSAADLMV